MGIFFRPAVTVTTAVCLALFMSTAHAAPVTTELGLVIDISGSVDAAEYNLQRQGYVDAFNNPAIQSLISDAPNGIAVSVFYFSTLVTANRTDSMDADYVAWSAPILDWTLLQDATDAAAFATAIGAIARPVVDPNDPKGDTNIAAGIDAAVSSIQSNTYEGSRLVIDISTDGVQNTEFDGTQPGTGCNGGLAQFQQTCFDVVEAQRNTAAGAGIVINGIAIETENTFGYGTLHEYLQDHVITGDGSFVAISSDFNTFGSALLEKLATELSAPVVPIPAAVYLFGSALLGLGSLVRRRKGH